MILRFAALGAVGGEEGGEFATDIAGDGAGAVHGPGEGGAAVGVLDEAGELRGVAGAKFAGGDSVVEKSFGFVADEAELFEGDGVEVGIGKVVLEPGEAVSHGFGSGSEGSAFGIKFDESSEKRFVFGAGSDEGLGATGGSGATETQDEIALGAEALN